MYYYYYNCNECKKAKFKKRAIGVQQSAVSLRSPVDISVFAQILTLNCKGYVSLTL